MAVSQNSMITVRIIAFITLLIVSTIVPHFIFLPAALLYALVWRGYELIVLAICIDAYFGVGHHIPYYSLYTSVIVLGAEWIKPSLLVYNK